MNGNDPYEQLGKWAEARFQINLIVCQAFGKRWAFKWSNTQDIENARRIQLTAGTGLIVPASISDEKAEQIKQEAFNYWQKL